MPVTIQEAYRNPNRLDKNRYALDKERPFKPVMEGKLIRITPDFSPETMKTRRSWADLIQIIRENKC